MSNIDKQALREAAEKASTDNHTQDEWFHYLRCSTPETVLALLDELEELQSFRTAFTEWLDKTEWVQSDKRFDVIIPWGKHRADVLKLYVEHLESKQEAAEKRIAELEVLAFSPAILDVISERQRQRSVEGWTTEHDDAYQNNELADAAACYAIHANNQGFSTPAHWPWDPEWWKQSGARRDLVKAGALILAEIERIDRAACKGEK